MLEVCKKWMKSGNPEELIRAARHYERASQIVIAQQVCACMGTCIFFYSSLNQKRGNHLCQYRYISVCTLYNCSPENYGVHDILLFHCRLRQLVDTYGGG